MRTDLTWRAALPVAAVAALVAQLPSPVAGCIALAGLLAAAERLVRLRAHGTADRVLLGVGGTLVALVLTGLVLGSTPLGLGRTTWVVALSLLAAVGLAVAAVRPAPAPRASSDGAASAARWRRAGPLARVVPWTAAAVVVAALSVAASVASVERADTAPVAMSFGDVSGTNVEVVVSAGEAVGPLEIRTVAEGNEISYPLFSLDAGDTSTTTVAVPVTGRFVVTVSRPDQTQPLRTLVLDR